MKRRLTRKVGGVVKRRFGNGFVAHTSSSSVARTIEAIAGSPVFSSSPQVYSLLTPQVITRSLNSAVEAPSKTERTFLARVSAAMYSHGRTAMIAYVKYGKLQWHDWRTALVIVGRVGVKCHALMYRGGSCGRMVTVTPSDEGFLGKPTGWAATISPIVWGVRQPIFFYTLACMESVLTHKETLCLR